MLDLPSLSRPLRRHVRKMLRKKTKTHGRGSRRLQRESNLLQSVGASSLQDGTMERLAHCYPGYRKCMMCVIRLSRYALFVTYFVRRSTLQLYLWFLSLLVSQVPFFPSAPTVDHQITGFHPRSSCQCTPDASVWIWKGGHRRWSEAIWGLVLTWLCDRPLF